MAQTTLSFTARKSSEAEKLVDRFIKAGWSVDRSSTLDGGQALIRIVAFADRLVGDVYALVDEMRAGLDGIKFTGQTAIP